MPKTKARAYPDISTLRTLMEEYLQVLRRADGVKKMLSLDPQAKGFGMNSFPMPTLLTQVGDGSSAIWEEITGLIDQFPGD